LAIGATRLPGGGHWGVFADPAAKPFCLRWQVDEETGLE
jgi:hypothetical protein